MFTKNWHKAVTACAFGNTDIEYVGATNTKGKFNNSRQGMMCLKKWISSEQMGWSPILENVITSLSAGTGGVAFGTGDTAPTIDDYTLSGDIISGLTTTASVSLEIVNDIPTLTAVYVLVNSMSDDVTIKEIGLFARLQTTTEASGKILMERTVLDTPVIIGAGGAGQVTYTIRMNYPTA